MTRELIDRLKAIAAKNCQGVYRSPDLVVYCQKGVGHEGPHESHGIAWNDDATRPK